MRFFGLVIAAAAMMFGASGAAAQPARTQSAAAFARSLYAGVEWRGLLTADTARLLRSAERRADGVMDYLDADPLCTCQDDEGIRVLSVRAAPARGGLMRASVRFEFIHDLPIPARTVHLLLARSGRGWRIQDIEYPYGARVVSYRWALRRNGGR